MSHQNTKVIEIAATLRLAIPADLNDAQELSILEDIRSENHAPTIVSGVMEEAIKQYMKSSDDWSHKQILGAELDIRTNTVSSSTEPLSGATSLGPEDAAVAAVSLRAAIVLASLRHLQRSIEAGENLSYLADITGISADELKLFDIDELCDVVGLKSDI